MKMTQPVPRLHSVLFRDSIRETLLERIGSGALVPGERIIEARLAEEFGVSAIPVREAIRELASMGVLEFANHRGAWVRVVSLEETMEALEVKAALEAQAAPAAAAALRHSCSTLHLLCRKLETAARRRDFKAYQTLNHSFHRQIVAASGNALLLKIWESLAFEVRTRPILEFLHQEDPMDIAAEHTAIVLAVESGDGPRASALLAGHAQRLVRHLRSLPEKEPAAAPVPRPARTRKTLTKPLARSA